jgi:hypothetical protein
MIAQLHTPCKDCVFAKYKDIEQIDCNLGLLEIYKKHGIDIIEVFDEEKEFFVINNIKCVYKRTINWKYGSCPLAEQISQVREETHLRFHAIILAKDNLEDVKNTLNSLIDQTLKPEHITIVRPYDSQIAPSQLAELCQYLPMKWRVENLVKPFDNLEDILKIILPFVRYKVYTVYYAGFIVPPDTLQDISTNVIDKFLSFMIILPNKDGNGMVGLSVVNEYYANHPGRSLKEKLEKDKCPPQLLIPITQILSYFPK